MVGCLPCTLPTLVQSLVWPTWVRSPAVHMVPWAWPGLIPVHRVRYKFWALLGVPSSNKRVILGWTLAGWKLVGDVVVVVVVCVLNIFHSYVCCKVSTRYSYIDSGYLAIDWCGILILKIASYFPSLAVSSFSVLHFPVEGIIALFWHFWNNGRHCKCSSTGNIMEKNDQPVRFPSVGVEN